MQSTTLRLAILITALFGLSTSNALPDNQELAKTLKKEGFLTDRSVKYIELSSGSQLEQILNDLNYTPEAWQAGIREIPRLYLTNITPRWREKTSKEIDVATKKRIFFRLLGPLILRSNEMIQKQRDQAQSVFSAMRKGEKIRQEDQALLREIAAAYKVLNGETDFADKALQDRLLRRVDILPPSLVLAQAAEESGWGTSRFAAEGNALFGMWTWGEDGVKPKQQRSGLGNYKIAAYKTPLHSVVAYMQNLNTHQAYRELRERRAELRKSKAKVTGWELANTLTKYSERGQAYVDSLHSLMKVNRLQPTDDAYLTDGPTILLFPVEKGAD